MDDTEKVWRVVALHDPTHSYLISECAEMLNREWRKSFELRERNLRESSDDFPYHVIFIESLKNDALDQLVGHARITKVLNKPDALYLSSGMCSMTFSAPLQSTILTVIIKEEKRGQGLGKEFMQLIANHIAKMGYKTIYLRTDSAGFYMKCGYIKCDPVQEVANIKMEEKLGQLSAAYGAGSKYSSSSNADNGNQHICRADASPAPSCQIPPAPPVPKISCGSRKTLYNCVNDECGEFQCQFWMKKVLT